MKLIERKQYLDKLINVIGTPDIKVITGVRRSGKSKLLDAFKEYIEENIPNYNIVHMIYAGLARMERLIWKSYPTQVNCLECVWMTF